MTIALLIIGLVLIVLNIKSIKKEEKSFKQALNISEDNLGDFAVEVGTLRKEFAESILELQSEIEELKEKISKGENEHKNIETLESPKEKNQLKLEIIDSDTHLVKDSVELLSKADVERYVTEIEKETFNDNGIKTQQIQTMINEGYSVDEISEKLNIGKGEVLLIKDLYIK